MRWSSTTPAKLQGAGRIVSALLFMASIFAVAGIIWFTTSATLASQSIDALPLDVCPDQCVNGAPGSVPTVAIVSTINTPFGTSASVNGPIDALRVEVPTGEPGSLGAEGDNATLTVTLIGNASGVEPSVDMTITAPDGYDSFATAGPRGPPGTDGTIVFGATITGAAGSNCTVSNEATNDTVAIFVFQLPVGDTGAEATVAVGATTSGAPGSEASVTNAGTSATALLNFTLPRGVAGLDATVSIGNVTLLSPGAEPTVAVVAGGTLNFGLPVGATGAPGSGANITVTIISNGTTRVTQYVLPGPSGVVMVINETIVYIAVPGPQGPTGEAASVSIGPVSTALPGTNASVVNVGNATTAIFDFIIPVGPQGEAASIAISSVASTTAGAQVTIANQGGITAAVYQFTVPPGAQGTNGTITVGSVTTLASGANATLVNVGTSQAAIWNWGIPQGQQGVAGESASVTVGTVTALAAGANATVTNSGLNNSVVVLNFGLPVGVNGLNDSTISVGGVTTGPAGGPVTVTNSGNQTAQVLNFDIPYALNTAQMYSSGGNISCPAGGACGGNLTIFQNATNLNNFVYAFPDGLTYTGSVNITVLQLLSITFSIQSANAYPLLSVSFDGCGAYEVAMANITYSTSCTTLLTLTPGKTFTVVSAFILNDGGTFVVHQAVATFFY